MKSFSFSCALLCLSFVVAQPVLAQDEGRHFIKDTVTIDMSDLPQDQRQEFIDSLNRLPNYTGADSRSIEQQRRDSEDPRSGYYGAPVPEPEGTGFFREAGSFAYGVYYGNDLEPVRQRPSRGQFSFSPYVGTGFSIYGMAFEEYQFSETIRIGETTISPLAGTRIDSQSQNFGDVFYPKISIGGEFGLGLSRNTEIYGGISYAFAQSMSFDAFSFSGPADVSNGGVINMVDRNDEIRGQFSDYHSFYLGTGVRRFINPEKRLTPFVSASVGVKFVSAIDLALELNGVDLGNDDNADSSYYNQSTTFQLGLGAGLLYDVNDRLSVGLETGLHYNGSLTADDSALSGGAQGLNDWSTDLSIPIMATARINFMPD